MAIINRLVRLWKADLHGVMDQLEDKQLLLKQYLREMEASLDRKENRMAVVAQNCRQVKGDVRKRSLEIDHLEQDLDLAIHKEKDDIARMLIRKKRSQQETLKHLQAKSMIIEQERQQLAHTMERQRLQYGQLKIKADIFGRKMEPCLDGNVPGEHGSSSDWREISDEEVELELLQRKETLQQGGAS